MTCKICGIVRHYVLNIALAVDRLLNAALLGNANETLSQRTARAELAGNKFAKLACRIIGLVDRNHCAWSLEPGTVGSEIWPWSPK